MRSAVALLFTLVIVMLMTMVIGWSMQRLGEAKKSVEQERFMIQSALIVEDVMGILKNSPEINAVADENSSAALFMLLEGASILPFESQGYRLLITLKSARDRVNINTFAEHNTTRQKARREYFANFLSRHGFGSDLYNYILDSMGGIKEDGSYRSDLFYSDPELYRDAIVSPRQMERILSEYAKKEGLDPFSKLDFDKIFRYSQERDYKLDLNYATPEAWEFVTGVPMERAKELAKNGGTYTSLEELGLQEDEKRVLELFDYSFFEPVILVHIDAVHEQVSGMIEFEYDIKKKKAKRFVFEIQK